MKAKVIGIGAAGNKAAITLIEREVVGRTDVMLLNSTLKDIPYEYNDIAVQLTNSTGGCGKERDLAKTLALDTIKDNTNLFDGFLDPDDDMVIIVNSSEGGTGCGASVVIAKYFKEVLDTNVHLFVFTGFEDDGRGLQNTVEYFQEITDLYTVQAISNKKFLEEAGNKLKAEKMANEAFAMKVKILLGQIIIDSEQNIDETDLYKLSTTPGYMMIEFTTLDKIKNVESFNKVMTSLIDNSKSLDISEPSAKRLGLIFNIADSTADNVDFSGEVIRKKLGFPYEYYQHIQSVGDTEYVAFIASGMNMPIDEIKAVFEKYKEASSKVNKKKDDFFGIISDLRGNHEDAMFNMDIKPAKKAGTNSDKKAFFESFGVESPDALSKFQNTKVKKVDPEEELITKY